MKFEIRSAKNGWICKEFDDENGEEIVGSEHDDEHDAFVDFLRSILMNWGPSDSKYSPKRIRVICMPGNSYEGVVHKEYYENLKWAHEEIGRALENIKVES